MKATVIRVTGKWRKRAMQGAACAILTGLAAGCASPGPPRPPSLHLPAVVTDLGAERVGDDVRLRWTTPDKTTDGEAIRGQITAVLCREDGVAVKGAKPPACNPVQRIAAVPGPSAAVEKLHGAQTADPVGLLGYRVELLNAKGHTAGWSAAVCTAGGSAPGAVNGVHATGRREGVLIAWAPGADEVEVSRRLVLDADGKPPVVKPGSKDEVGGHRNERIQVELQASAVEDRRDPGGMLDEDANRGPMETYRYTARRVRTVYGPDNRPIGILGPQSVPVEYTVRDVFPPQVPAGLAAVPGTHAVDLSWQPVPDVDLAGYMVYRRAGESGGWVRLTASPIQATAYADTTVEVEGIYFYHVTAVDQNGNESKPGAEVREPPN